MQGRHTHERLDLLALFRPVTKHSERLFPAWAGQQILQALDLTMVSRPGPVHLSLTGADADAPAGGYALSPVTPLAPQHLEKKLAAAQALLQRARRPVIMIGLGLEPERPYVELRELAEAVQAPVIDTPKSKGGLANDHPLFAGTIGLTQNDPAYSILRVLIASSRWVLMWLS